MPASARARTGSTPISPANALQGVGERLPALRKHAAYHPLEQCGVLQLEGGRPEAEADERRAHVRRRPKRPWRNREQPGDVCAPLHQHAQHAVLRRSGLCDDAVGDFALEHQRRIRDRAPRLAVRAVETGSATRCCREDCRRRVSAYQVVGSARVDVEVEHVAGHDRRVRREASA